MSHANVAMAVLPGRSCMLPSGLILCVEDLVLYGPVCCQVVWSCVLRTWSCMVLYVARWSDLVCWGPGLVWSCMLPGCLILCVEDLVLYGPVYCKVVWCYVLRTWSCMVLYVARLSDLVCWGPGLVWSCMLPGCLILCVEDLVLYGPVYCKVVWCYVLRTWSCMVLYVARLSDLVCWGPGLVWSCIL